LGKRTSHSGFQFFWGVGIQEVTIDPDGNVILAGTFSEQIDFDPSAANLFLEPVVFPQALDLYILNLNSIGEFQWVRQLGSGTESENISDFELDASGSIYFTGRFIGLFDFDPGVNEFILDAENADAWACYVSKLDKDGNFVWAKKVSGPSANAKGSALDLDEASNVYITGSFQFTADFDPNPNAVFELTASGTNLDMFVFRLTAGGEFVWAISLGSPEYDLSLGIVVD